MSEVQRRQMTTVTASNVHNVALAGTFDDCQDMVKALFADAPFRDRLPSRCRQLDQLGPSRSAGRLLRHLRARARRDYDEAGVVRGTHRQLRERVLGMGCQGDGLADRPADHRVESQRHPHPRCGYRDDEGHRGRADDESSMDIQVRRTSNACCSSLNGRDGGMTAEQMGVFRSRGSLSLEADQTEQLPATFDAARCDEDETLRENRTCARRVRHRRRSAHGGRFVGGTADPP